MEFENNMTKYIKHKNIVDSLEGELRKSIGIVLREYYLREVKVNKELRRLPVYTRERSVPVSVLDNFEILEEKDDYYTINCIYIDDGSDDYSFNIKVPKDLNKTPSYVEDFDRELRERIAVDIEKEKKAKEERRYKEYLKLKEEFEDRVK